jgi:hypothetical protein
VHFKISRDFSCLLIVGNTNGMKRLTGRDGLGWIVDFLAESLAKKSGLFTLLESFNFPIKFGLV